MIINDDDTLGGSDKDDAHNDDNGVDNDHMEIVLLIIRIRTIIIIKMTVTKIIITFKIMILIIVSFKIMILIIAFKIMKHINKNANNSSSLRIPLCR